MFSLFKYKLNVIFEIFICLERSIFGYEDCHKIISSTLLTNFSQSNTKKMGKKGKTLTKK
jgi:hypothetical protein